jgi:glycosyltransferase involved in cell wall biosynthesis
VQSAAIAFSSPARYIIQSNMRIAFLTFEFPDARPGGVGSYVLKCSRALAAIGHEPHIFTLSVPQGVRDRLPVGVHLHEVEDVAQRVECGTLPGPLAAAALAGTEVAYKLLVGALLCDALRSKHHSHPYDIVEAAECEGLALPLLVHPIPDLPVVVQIHLGYAANSFGNSIPAQERNDLAQALELASIVGADAVCAATQSVVDVTRSLCPFSREVTIIPHPVETPEGGSPSRASQEGPALFVGRLHLRKGCDVLASAADIFLRRNPLARFHVAGSDTRSGHGGQSMLAEMLARVDPSVRSRFIYLGELSQGDVRREVEACRFQVVPSVVENFANTAIDAMAAARLVIYGGNTGLDEVIGDAGIRVWPLTSELLAEKMELAWKTPALAEEMGLRALARLRGRFDAKRISRQRIEFFQRVISDHRSAEGSGDRQWQALSGPQIKGVLDAFISQISGTLGLDAQTPSPGRVLTANLTALSQRLNRPPTVWLFGAGRFTLRLLGERHRWESLGFNLAGIVDEHPRFQQNRTYLGFEVKTPADLCAEIDRGMEVDAIILSTDTLIEVFRQKAKCFVKRGIDVFTLSDTEGR